MKTLLELATEVYADKFVYNLTSPIQAAAWIETVGMKLFDNQPTKEGTEFFVIQLFKWKLISTTAKFYESRLNAPILIFYTHSRAYRNMGIDYPYVYRKKSVFP